MCLDIDNYALSSYSVNLVYNHFSSSHSIQLNNLKVSNSCVFAKGLRKQEQLFAFLKGPQCTFSFSERKKIGF